MAEAGRPSRSQCQRSSASCMQPQQQKRAPIYDPRHPSTNLKTPQQTAAPSTAPPALGPRHPFQNNAITLDGTFRAPACTSTFPAVREMRRNSCPNRKNKRLLPSNCLRKASRVGRFRAKLFARALADCGFEELLSIRCGHMGADPNASRSRAQSTGSSSDMAPL